MIADEPIADCGLTRRVAVTSIQWQVTPNTRKVEGGFQ